MNISLIQSFTTCIIGGGNSAHVLIPFLSEAGHRVNLLTRRPDDWHDVIYTEITDGITAKVESTHIGRICKKSSEPEYVVPEADIIILCMPVHQYRRALDRIAPFIAKDKEVYIGTIYGQAAFNWMVQAIEKDQGLMNVVRFAIGQIPWICRTIEYGQSAANFGAKQVNIVAVSPADRFNNLNNIFLRDICQRPLGKGEFIQAENFLSLTMSVDNQIIHPARCYGLWQHYHGARWESDVDVPYFYRDFDERSAEILQGLDDDYSSIRSALRKHFPDMSFKYMLSYLELEKLNHNSDHPDILSSFRKSKQLVSIKTPTVVGPDGTRTLNTKHRFFADDIPYGLLIAKAIGERLNVATPCIAEVITWAQTMRGEHFLLNGNINYGFCLQDKYTCGIPESYGITSLKDIIE